MLQSAVTCLLLALIPAVLGFGGMAGSFVGVAKILFVVFLASAVLSFFFETGCAGIRLKHQPRKRLPSSKTRWSGDSRSLSGAPASPASKRVLNVLSH